MSLFFDGFEIATDHGCTKLNKYKFMIYFVKYFESTNAEGSFDNKRLYYNEYFFLFKGLLLEKDFSFARDGIVCFQFRCFHWH